MSQVKQKADALLTEAYEKYNTQLIKFCYTKLIEDKTVADDIAQEAMLVYYKRMLKGEEFEKPLAFLYQTAHNLCKNANKKATKQAMRTVPLENATDVAAQEENSRASELDYDEIKEKLLEKLSEQELMLYQLKYVENKSLKEISEMMDISPNAVAKRTQRLRSVIKELVEPTLSIYEGRYS
ncbi:MAG: sigma-70 family RNA polymerase sigma factor [Eubacterium sp.]|nr:sigma-70 family RNA polymerase sigma factor [Eubacterium sp.]